MADPIISAAKPPANQAHQLLDTLEEDEEEMRLLSLPKSAAIVIPGTNEARVAPPVAPPPRLQLIGKEPPRSALESRVNAAGELEESVTEEDALDRAFDALIRMRMLVLSTP
jgi:hypothetical protein